MDKTAPALELRDIHLPMEPGYWPLAPGWWVLIVLALILSYFIIKKLAKIQQAKHLTFSQSRYSSLLFCKYPPI